MTFKKEIPSLLMIALPLVYLALIWNELAEQVPIHWNASGEIDRYGTKYTLAFLALLVPGITYLSFVLIQRFGPTEKLNKMGRKFGTLKFLLMLLMAVLTLFIIHSSKQGALAKPTFIFVFIGLLITTFGNFFRTIQPNYFIGIRTPWTLKNQTVWKLTHEFAGKLWFVGGLLITLIALINTGKWASYCIVGILAIIVILPLIYSYLKSKSLKKNQSL